MHYDAIVIGGGPGGYVCAIRLGQLGKKTLLVEKNRVGGVCLQCGCIPSKALIHVADVYRQIADAHRMGIHYKELEIRWNETQAWKQSIVDRLTRGIHQLLKGNRVDFLSGEASITGPHQVEVKTDEGVQRFTTDALVVATGSEPVAIPGFSFDGERILNSTHALNLETIPASMAVIGGGYIGLELGQVYASFGTKVTIVEMMDQILPGVSSDLVKVLERKLRRLKVDIHTGAMARDLRETGEGLELIVEKGKETLKIACEKVLVTVGRRPTASVPGLDRVGVERDEKGFIRVNEKRQTSVPWIYAIGDVAGQPMLAHKASHEGEIVAEVIAGHPVACDYQVVPAVIFTHPEIATVGVTEHEARKQNIEIRIGRFPFAALGKAQTMNETDGFVKVITDPEGLVIGGEIVGPGASSLIAELALAIEMGAEVNDLALTIHTHPTLPEAIMEAAKAVYGQAIHILND